MTFDPRARAREIATKAYSTADTYSRIGQHLSAVSAIESALLTFAREVLTQEPDDGMIKAGNEAAQSPQGYRHTMRGMWSAMSAVRVKSLEDGK